ncbi:MAG: HAD hydrolase-like protein [Bacteroidales bacterium]|nr:HAD hydrolase-like protein [Bacteroidales bacterium]
MKEKLIIWDWNGTLLSDVDACVNSVNEMLELRQMKLLSRTSYKNVFTFPVQDYYNNIGFDFKQESFEKLAVEYIDLYKRNSVDSPLQAGAKEALQYYKKCNYKQIIVSASEQMSLENQVKQRGIYEYFDSILGLNNIHAKSKTENAINYLKTSEQFDQIVLIGDTFHDYEVANVLGCKCILVNNGHQNLNRFNLNSNVVIIESLIEVLNQE